MGRWIQNKLQWCRTDLLPYALYNMTASKRGCFKMQAEVVQFKQQQLQCIISLSPLPWQKQLTNMWNMTALSSSSYYYYKNLISGKGPWKILIHSPSAFSVGTEKGPACNVRLMSAKACSKETFCICVNNPLVAILPWCISICNINWFCIVPLLSSQRCYNRTEVVLNQKRTPWIACFLTDSWTKDRATQAYWVIACEGVTGFTLLTKLRLALVSPWAMERQSWTQ